MSLVIFLGGTLEILWCALIWICGTVHGPHGFCDSAWAKVNIPDRLEVSVQRWCKSAYRLKSAI